MALWKNWSSMTTLSIRQFFPLPLTLLSSLSNNLSSLLSSPLFPSLLLFFSPSFHYMSFKSYMSHSFCQHFLLQSVQRIPTSLAAYPSPLLSLSSLTVDGQDSDSPRLQRSKTEVVPEALGRASEKSGCEGSGSRWKCSCGVCGLKVTCTSSDISWQTMV